MAAYDEVVIISGCRTPVGKFQGSLSDLSATQLGAIVVREAVKRAQLDPRQVDECIMGNVVSAGLGQNPARQAAIFGGLPPEVGAMTVNKVCGSGLKAVALAAQAIQTENSSIVVAGGMESMTNAPYLLPQARKGYRLGNAQIVDSMVNDGLWDIYNNYHMGITGENVAEKYGITREEQDEFAHHPQRLHGKRLVQFIEIYILVFPTCLRPDFSHRTHRRHHHPGRVNAAGRLRNDSYERLRSKFLGVRSRGDDHGRGSVIYAGRVAGRNGAVLFKGRLQ